MCCRSQYYVGPPIERASARPIVFLSIVDRCTQVHFGMRNGMLAAEVAALSLMPHVCLCSAS